MSDTSSDASLEGSLDDSDYEESGSERTASPEVSLPHQPGTSRPNNLVDSKPRKNPQRKRQAKDPNAPNKPLSAYLMFLLEKQNEIRKSNTDAKTVAEVTRQVGAAWRELPEEEKREYSKKADILKAEYVKECKKYEASDEHKRFQAQQMKLKQLEADSELASAKSLAKKNPDKNSHGSGITPSVVSFATSSKTNRGNVLPEPISSAGKKPVPKRRSFSSEYSDTPGKKVKKSVKPVKQEENEDDLNDDEMKKFSNQIPASVVIPGSRVNPASDANAASRVPTTFAGKLEEIRIPIWTSEFMEWNTKRERELKQIRHAADDLDIDVAGMKLQREQLQKCAEEVVSCKKKLEDIRKAKKEVKKMVINGFSGVKLPNGLQIDDSNVLQFLAEVEKVASRSPARHSDLSRRLKELAVKLQPFAAFL